MARARLGLVRLRAGCSSRVGAMTRTRDTDGGMAGGIRRGTSLSRGSEMARRMGMSDSRKGDAAKGSEQVC
jgi:hypothetical protein